MARIARRPGAPQWSSAGDPGAKVLPHHAREHNRALVLQTLVTHGVLSRADIARKTSLTRVTVSELVAELVASALVVERGHRPETRPGKPATLLQVDTNSRHVVGVDLSDPSTFRSATMDLGGNVLATYRVERSGETGADAVAAAVRLARMALAGATSPVLGVGVGTPGIVDPTGTVLRALDLGWTDLPLQRLLADALEMPVHVANDANAAVMAESRFGQGADDLLLITVGSGVGAGILVNGLPRIGAHSAAGEIGHIVVGTDGGPPCVCGKDGCLETWLSVPNLQRAVSRALDDAARRDALAEAGRRLGIAMAPVVGTLDISDIAISGPPALLEGPLIEAAADALTDRMLTASPSRIEIRLASLDQDIVLLGCAAIVVAAELGAPVAPKEAG